MIWGQPILAAILVLAADQASKLVIQARPGAVVSRTGALGGRITVPALALAWLAAAVVIGLALDARLFGLGPVGPWAVGAALGGAASNLVDRAWRGGVVDFIALWPFRRFNLADAAITCGGALALLALA